MSSSILGGTYNEVENATSKAFCIRCPEGKYCPEGSSNDGLACPAGFYCTSGQGSGVTNACPIGTYSSQQGLISK